MKYLLYFIFPFAYQHYAEAIRGYEYEEPLLYDTFPEEFLWGTATAAYQVKCGIIIVIKRFKPQILSRTNIEADSVWIGHSNWDHATCPREGARSALLHTQLSKADLDRLLNKAIQAPSLGGGCVIPITVPY